VFRAHKPVESRTKLEHLFDASGEALCDSLFAIRCFHGRLVTEVEPWEPGRCRQCWRMLKYRLSGRVKLRLKIERAPGSFSDRTKNLPRREGGRWVKTEPPPSVEVG
jgi:hypothetical protein